jgi:Leucine-rich repeat (LRR) protein
VKNENTKTSAYRGVQLYKEDAAVLYELEEITESKIPSDKCGFYSAGFKHENRRIVGLSLHKIGLSSLPESISNLRYLQKLFLRDNQLRTLPKNIGEIKNLKNLDVFNNQIESLPDSIGNLMSLQRADLSRNPLKTLPDSICNLKNLERLGLLNVRLQYLPQNIGMLTQLWDLAASINQ